MPPTSRPLTQDNIWGEMTGVRGTWAVIGGVTKSRNITKQRNGGELKERSSRSKPSFSDMNLTLLPDTANVADVLADLEALDRNGGDTTVTKFIGDDNLTVKARRTYTCVLKEFTDPEGDANSTGNATVTAVVSVDDVQ